MKLNKLLILSGILVFLLIASTLSVSAYRTRSPYVESYSYGDNYYDFGYNSNVRDYGDFRSNDFRYGIGYDIGLRYEDTIYSSRDSLRSNSFRNMRTTESYDQGLCGDRKGYKGATSYVIKEYDIDDEDFTVREYTCGAPRIRGTRSFNEGFRIDQSSDRSMNGRNVNADFRYNQGGFTSSRNDRYGYDYSESVSLREINGISGRGNRIVLNRR